MEEGMETCPCRHVNCPRHGDCVSCRGHHRTPRRSGLTHCEKLERKRQKAARKMNEKERIPYDYIFYDWRHYFFP